MIPILDFQRRAQTGPVMKGDEFDMTVASKMRQMVKKYEITYNPEELIVDDATADKVFQAAVEYLAEVGLYHNDTFRVIQFTKEEIETIAREYRENQRSHVFGRGKEEICIQYRTGQDKQLPVVMVGATQDIPEEWFIPYFQHLAQEPTNHGMGCSGGITAVGGLAPKSGMLSEVTCAQWEQEALLEALRRAGREGMHLGVLATAFSFGAVVATLQSGLRDPLNTQLGIHIMPEQKIDWNRLLTAQFAEQNGYQPWTSAMSFIGGLCGGPAGAAVGMLGNLLAQLAYGHGDCGQMCTFHVNGQGGTREALWVYSAAARGAERNVRVPLGGIASCNQYYRGTPVPVYQMAASTIVSMYSGNAFLWAGSAHHLDTILIDGVLRGAGGLERGRANALVNAIMAKVDEVLPQESPTSKETSRYQLFVPFYDIEKIKPKPEFVANYSRATEDLARLGVPLPSGLMYK